MRLRSAAAPAAAAARLYGQLRVLVGAESQCVGQDVGHVFERVSMRLQSAHDRRHGVRANQYALHGPNDQQHDHDHRRAVRALLHLQHVDHDDDQSMRGIVQMGLGADGPVVDESLRPVRRELPVLGAGV